MLNSFNKHKANKTQSSVALYLSDGASLPEEIKVKLGTADIIPVDVDSKDPDYFDVHEKLFDKLIFADVVVINLAVYKEHSPMIVSYVNSISSVQVVVFSEHESPIMDSLIGSKNVRHYTCKPKHKPAISTPLQSRRLSAV
ncbi:hypothetical protein [Aureibacter tunicatorum]|uniref:Uncharacterized protein n=1 Tax=Aureibacter tunicatorum TaxID=866807 RepID=A0AAE4BU08_9BACT|nr:hypothetical protein [Aureibacter tunicatorum]MDR6240313.1 hypothetical protein [Aureibacter tunicatorum]BDD05806.1 hypothetical protein AUTU_32890 [Aureibacter tunicatorum]